MSHIFARCASQKTYGHARIARDSRMAVDFLTRATCKNVRQNLIPRATASARINCCRINGLKQPHFFLFLLIILKHLLTSHIIKHLLTSQLKCCIHTLDYGVLQSLDLKIIEKVENLWV